jgi:hypothetical protein
MEVEWGVGAKNSAGQISFQMQDLSKINYLIRREISDSTCLSTILHIQEKYCDDRSADFRDRNILASNGLGLATWATGRCPSSFSIFR